MMDIKAYIRRKTKIEEEYREELKEVIDVFQRITSNYKKKLSELEQVRKVKL